MRYLNTNDWQYYKLAPTSGVIDLSGRYWQPVDFEGRSNTQRAILDGNGTVIKGLNIDVAGGTWGGLFEFVSCAEINNLVIAGPALSGALPSGNMLWTGALASQVLHSTVRSVRVENPIIDITFTDTNYDEMIGGLVGDVEESVLHDCSVIGGKVMARSSGSSSSNETWLLVGGIAGDADTSSINNATSITMISASDNLVTTKDKYVYVGGIVGSTHISGVTWCVVNSYAAGSVSATQSDSNAAGTNEVYAGGIAGYLEDSAANNYSRATVSASSVGGFATKGQLVGIAQADVDCVKGGDGTVGTADDGKYLIRDNWYLGSGAAIGQVKAQGAPAASFNPNAGVAPITSPSVLLAALNRTDGGHGRGAAVEALTLHGYTTGAALVKVFAWKIVPGVNAGYPVFANDTTKPDPNDPSYPQTVAQTDLSKVAVSIADKVWTGKKIAGSLTVKVGSKVLKSGTDYTLSKAGANVNIGVGTITVTGKGASYKGSKVVKFKIIPTTPKLSKAKAAKKSAKVTWKKVNKKQKITKYELQYRIKGKKWSKAKAVNPKKAALTIKRLKVKKVYQFRLRCYKKVGKVKYYSAWSVIKASKKIK